MSTKKQHFVPRVYMKAWETQVETSKEPEKKFQGIYVIKDGVVGEGANRESILWKPHLYTINFKYSFICNSCSRVKTHFVEMIYEFLRKGFEQPVYAKYGYSIIKTKKSIQKHFFEIHDWEFYYEDGNIARKKSILNQIEEFNCYILEDAFDDYLEKNMGKIINSFIENVHNGIPLAIGRSERIIPEDVARDMLGTFFVMLCRNPLFDAMGIYTQIKENVLYPLFLSICQDCEKDGDYVCKSDEGKKDADELMLGIWYSELYKMFFRNTGGFYHNMINVALKGCQMILFEAYEGAGYFITSDNPAFENNSIPEKENSNGMIFPLTPKYLLFIARGLDGINVVDHRFANTDTIKHFNRIIARYKNETIISLSKELDDSV